MKKNRGIIGIGKRAYLIFFEIAGGKIDIKETIKG